MGSQVAHIQDGLYGLEFISMGEPSLFNLASRIRQGQKHTHKLGIKPG